MVDTSFKLNERSQLMKIHHVIDTEKTSWS